jgi:hypothetical protein
MTNVHELVEIENYHLLKLLHEASLMQQLYKSEHSIEAPPRIGWWAGLNASFSVTRPKYPTEGIWLHVFEFKSRSGDFTARLCIPKQADLSIKLYVSDIDLFASAYVICEIFKESVSFALQKALLNKRYERKIEKVISAFNS